MKIKELKELAKIGSITEDYIREQIKNIPPLPAGMQYDFDFAREYNAATNGWEFIVTARPVEAATCEDNRIEIIESARRDLIEHTNIESSPEEMAVLDNILFRCWQMGWLEKYNQ